MTEKLRSLMLTLLLLCLMTVGAQAMENNMLKVGLKYGDNAQFSVRLQNYSDAPAGCGYYFGYYDSARSFVPIAETEVRLIAITIDANAYVSGEYCYEKKPASYSTMLGGYHIQLTQKFSTYEEAMEVAQQFSKAFVAYVDGSFCVRIGNHASKSESEGVLLTTNTFDYETEIVGPSRTGVTVSVPGTDTILFEMDYSGLRSLAIMPHADGDEKPATWSGGYRYYGGFEFPRTTGGYLSVINVVGIEDYVKCVIPYEMSADWPLEALKTQSVCARTYAAQQKRHRSAGFDVCTTTDCQVYYGSSKATEYSDSAVDQTAGMYLYYNGALVSDAVYYSSNGGASEDCKNVWGSEVGYLKGKVDPYEADIVKRASGYYWSFSVTPADLTKILKAKGVDIGTVQNVYVSKTTPTGNVCEVTFEGTSGKYVAAREKCRLIFNGVISGVNVKSMRYTIKGGGAASAPGYYVNDSKTTVQDIGGCYVIGGDGKVMQSSGAGDTYVITASGVAPLGSGTAASTAASDKFTFSGSGSGHNVGMSQWGAFAMAERGFSYRDILEFYYTGVEIR